MDIDVVAALLGGKVIGPRSVQFPTPGHSPRDLGSIITLDPSAPDGFLVHSHNGYHPLALKDYVRERLGLARARFVNQVIMDTSPGFSDDASERIRAALAIWETAGSIAGTLVEAYLAHRGLQLSRDLIHADQIRFHPRCRIGGEYHPAMIALMRNNQTGEPSAIHRTALASDGRGKATMSDGGNPKRMLGVAKGAAIRLGAIDGPKEELGIAEGIETALAIQQMGFPPVWAVGSSSAMAAFDALDGLRRLTIFADSDAAGLEAGRSCARRMSGNGIVARLVAPRKPDSDWNDGRAAP